MKRTTSREDEMTRTNTTDRLPRELAHRANDGLEVWLLWTKADGRLFVLVHDGRQGASFELDVDSATALDAFDHPYAYAARCGVEYSVPRRRDETLVPAA
jgi:hypothetical protein